MFFKGAVNRMKILKTVVLSLCFVMILGSFFSVCAAEKDNPGEGISYSIDIEDDALQDAVLVSENTYIENNRMITEKVYELPDGNTLTDTLNISATATQSESGSDTATRSRTISNWGTITIRASFTWYKEGWFSYVKCTSMSAYKNLSSNVTVSTWDTSCTENYVSIGKAYAQVKYHFYQTNLPTQFTDGTFKITCTDSGTISDGN